MSPASEPAHHDDLREYVRVIRSRKWTIALTTCVVVAATVFFTLRQTPIYRATAEILVQPVQNPLSLFTPPIAPDMNTEQQVATSQAVADQVLKTMSLPVPFSELTDNLDVAVVPDTDVLQVSYSSPSPGVAAKMANAFSRAYITFRTDQVVQRLQVAADTVKRQIDNVKKQLDTVNGQISRTSDSAGDVLSALTSQRQSLISRLGTLQDQYSAVQPSATAVQGSGVIVQQATAPTSPASPNKIRNGVLGLVIGLGLGIGVAFLRERFDDRIRGREEVERLLGAPVLAIVPKVANWKRTEDSRLVMVSDPKSPVSEAYRTLATNILYTASRRKLEMLLITSGTSTEGKTTTAANLGVALAQTGKRVILVSADMRKPRLHRFFALTNELGLSDLLAGRAPLINVALQTPVRGLRVIPGGPVPHNPATLLAGPGAMAALEEMRAAADFIILDAPPALAVADASIVAPHTDATLYVMDADKVSRSSLSQARRQLENAGADLAGAVFNNFDTTKGAGYQYSYYTYYYEYRETEGKDKGNGARLRQSADRRRAGKAIGFEHDETPAAGLPEQALASEGPLPSGSPGGHTNGGSATNGGDPTNDGSSTDDLASSAWLEGLTAPAPAPQGPQASAAPVAPKTPQAQLPPSQPRAVASPAPASPPIASGPVALGPITSGGSPKPLQATPSSDDEDRRDGRPWWTPQSS
jgi:capsular exopolysaccharide synthesis family protein